MFKIDSLVLPERLQERGLDVLVTDAREMPDAYISQLVDKSRQHHIMEFEGAEDVTGDPGRFRDIDSYHDWADGKQRVFYMLINDALHPDDSEVPDIGGVIWFGERTNEHAPDRDLTFAIRLYASDEDRGWAQYRGTGLGSPFMQATHRNLVDWYQNRGIWLDLVDGNEAAHNLYQKNGYVDLKTLNDEAHGGQRRTVMANDNALRLVPQEVEAAFYPDGTEKMARMDGGMINTTLLVKTDHDKQILQQLKPIFKPELLDDYQKIAEHLRVQGWEIPRMLPAPDGTLYQRDSQGQLWRAFEYLETDADTGSENSTSYADYGTLLGKLHRSLALLDYEPRFTLDHFHDTDHYAGVLRDVRAEIPSSEAFVDGLLEAHSTLESLPEVDEQLIHGDPRANNMLYRDGKAFTFIDWDTAMKGTIWMDLGDMLRSMSEESLKAGKPVPIDDLRQLIKGYRQTYCPDVDAKEFEHNAFLAGQTIALELAMRFAADHKDGDAGYFDWDATKHASRHEHNLERAATQQKIFNSFQARRTV